MSLVFGILGKNCYFKFLRSLPIPFHIIIPVHVDLDHRECDGFEIENLTFLLHVEVKKDVSCTEILKKKKCYVA